MAFKSSRAPQSPGAAGTPVIEIPLAWGGVAGAAVAFFAARLALLAVSGWNTADEAWILQIVERVGRGEVLYRDVQYNCTPVAIYLARGVCGVTGTSVLALKGLCAGIEMGIFLATLGFMRRLMAPAAWPGRGQVWLLGLVMVLIPGPPMAHLYNDLATLLTLLGGMAVLHWRQVVRGGAAGSVAPALLIGLVLGLAVGEKQNIGVYLSLAAAAVMLLTQGIGVKRRVRDVLVTAGVAAVVLAVVLAPTLVAGAGQEMITDTLLMKGQYLHAAGVNFFAGFEEWVELIPRVGEFDATAHFAARLVFPLALLSAGALVAGLFWPATRGALRVALPFLFVLAVGVYPRADAWHVGNAYPAMVIVLGVVGASVRPGIRRVLTGASAGLAGCLAILLVLGGAWRLTSGQYVFSRLPHLEGVLVGKGEEARLGELSVELARLPQPIFILSAEASGLYLVSGTRNPTPYDYAISSELPGGACQKIAEDLRAGRIRRLILEPRERWYSPLFIPEQLQAMGEKEGVREQDIGPLQVRRFSPNP